MIWKNWSGTVENHPKEIVYATSVEQVQGLVKRAHENGDKIRVVASGHSFSEVCKSDEILLDISSINGMDTIDRERKQITFWAGTTVNQAGKICVSEGFAQENLGDFDHQTLAGAVSTGTHGTGKHLGGIAQQIVAFWVVNAQGELLECSQTKNATLFEAGRVGLGVFGVLVKVKLQLVDCYRLKCETQRVNLLEILPEIPEMLEKNRNLEFFWFPMTPYALCKKMNITQEPVSDPKFKRFINQHILENIGLKWICQATYHLKLKAKKVNAFMAKMVGNDVRINTYNEILATDRSVKFMEMEYNIPAEKFPDFFKTLYQLIEKKQYNVYFPVEIRWVKEDDIWLSPTYKRNAVYVALHCYHKAFVAEYFNDVEQLAQQFEGRPHWGKMHSAKHTYLQKVYEKWDDFLNLRAETDPDKLFINPHLEACFGLHEK